jgi:hypothetical protein
MKMRKAHRSTYNGVGSQCTYSIPNYNPFYFDIYIYISFVMYINTILYLDI